MNWYNLFKFSALEPNWWQSFYDHFTKAIPFVMNMQNANIRFNTSGVDGNKVWYSFNVGIDSNKYSCTIQLEFSSGLPNGGGQTVWKNSTLQQVMPQGNVELVKFHWYVLKNMHLGGSSSELVGQGFILAQNATPVSVLTQIKNAILQDLEDDDDDDGDIPYIDDPSSDSGELAPVLAPLKSREMR